ncbi:MAG TPA: KOW domain-containing RNA-binding protein [Candidatus Avimonoglobus intestinipullorum]|uniref:KOW domain-containing RNA-binding protein n=1 Tax=Candidatus Avimonoglobus intestinipullorum TaxID=2840699 RepID=A0A9D1LU57_9FIRM|nr:KOW domain-containing RNA-binding protein [Candidatus Avimonoglobus intestinipullorum]
MEICKGSVVFSKAGRDKGGAFLVLRVDGGYAAIADGRLRRVEKPKRKKLKHLQKTNNVLELETDADGRPTNAQVRKALAPYKPSNAVEGGCFFGKG